MNIRLFVLVALTLFLPFLASSGAPTQTCEPVFEATAVNRSLPHAYVDQGLSSLPHLYPNHALLLQRRSSIIGGVAYSLLAYKQDKAVESVTIEGVAVSEQNAWLFTVTCSSDTVMEGLVTTLERIAALPKRAQ